MTHELYTMFLFNFGYILVGSKILCKLENDVYIEKKRFLKIGE